MGSPIGSMELSITSQAAVQSPAMTPLVLSRGSRESAVPTGNVRHSLWVTTPILIEEGVVGTFIPQDAGENITPRYAMEQWERDERLCSNYR